MSSDPEVPPQPELTAVAGSAAATAGDLDVERDSDVPISTQIYWQIAYQIDSGRLLPGARLAPVRELGAALRVNPNTIRAVYRRLADAGYVTSRHGAGTHVADRPPQRRGAEALAGIVAEMLRRAAAAGLRRRRGRLGRRSPRPPSGSDPARWSRSCSPNARTLTPATTRSGSPTPSRRPSTPRARSSTTCPSGSTASTTTWSRRRPSTPTRPRPSSAGRVPVVAMLVGPGYLDLVHEIAALPPGSRVGLVCASARGRRQHRRDVELVRDHRRGDRVGDDRRRPRRSTGSTGPPMSSSSRARRSHSAWASGSSGPIVSASGPTNSIRSGLELLRRAIEHARPIGRRSAPVGLHHRLIVARGRPTADDFRLARLARSRYLLARPHPRGRPVDGADDAARVNGRRGRWSPVRSPPEAAWRPWLPTITEPLTAGASLTRPGCSSRSWAGSSIATGRRPIPKRSPRPRLAPGSLGNAPMDQAVAAFATEFPALGSRSPSHPIHRPAISQLLLLATLDENPRGRAVPRARRRLRSVREGRTLAPSRRRLTGSSAHRPGFGPDGRSLVELLRQPAAAAPGSLADQLRWIRTIGRACSTGPRRPARPAPRRPRRARRGAARPIGPGSPRTTPAPGVRPRSTSSRHRRRGERF